MSVFLDQWHAMDRDPDPENDADLPQPCTPDCRRYAEALLNKGYALQTEIDRLTGQNDVLLRTWQMPTLPAGISAVIDESGTVWVHAGGDYWLPQGATTDEQASTWAEMLGRGMLVDATAQRTGGAS